MIVTSWQEGSSTTRIEKREEVSIFFFFFLTARNWRHDDTQSRNLYTMFILVHNWLFIYLYRIIWHVRACVFVRSYVSSHFEVQNLFNNNRNKVAEESAGLCKVASSDELKQENLVLQPHTSAGRVVSGGGCWHTGQAIYFASSKPIVLNSWFLGEIFVV